MSQSDQIVFVEYLKSRKQPTKRFELYGVMESSDSIVLDLTDNGDTFATLYIPLDVAKAIIKSLDWNKMLKEHESASI